ncbi:archaellin/type IV pilin N-terminal domain-containing protein [Haloarchaeobius sp. DFWS5]|uniref:archaellin/type IV pilin N-terminal domain-containing protein n=1 Tax=Haloarchaeobius sp. DFWS5 TaxID=3446114 RepID=UPI003EBCCFDF
MIVENTVENERGQVGIGTLIIFIAMVLVAAVAAGVLINTSGMLESQASDTGEDSQAQVSNQYDVITAVGEDADSNRAVETLNFTVKKSAGADALDLNQTTIEYLSDGDRVSLTHDNGGASGSAFGTTSVAGNGDDVLENASERLKITIDLASAASELNEGEEATVRIVDQSGATTIYGVNVPDTISGDTFVEV